ncbi:MAG: 2-hydroxychromene-2-carboxylate isomerase [Burkholderiaceae bacterium]
MALSIDYYFAPQSPWTYLGHARFTAMARAAGAAVQPRPVDFGKIFAASGGLPLAKRAAQRQAYRLVELARFRDHVGVPLNLQPKFFPVPADRAARLLIAVDMHDGSEAAMTLAGTVFGGVWGDQRNIDADADLAQMLAEHGLPARRIEDALAADVQQRYERDTQHAIDLGVFGAPTYVIDGELFWGQDRLDFVERRLAQG